MSVFFDSNVLIYRIDYRDAHKNAIAAALIDAALADGSAMISTQSLQEFYSAATRKLGIPAEDVKNVAVEYRRARIVQLTPKLIFAAMSRHGAGGFSFWDALIVEAALYGGAKILYSEDMQDGMRVDGLTIRNPFGA